uniref:Uncharacterized protein n=1 Tax=Branchiostoma floridae TaxID=7739 RepID=C3ZCT1_BRAFL|eukprot:XP_002593573.1 hypothetical protein BRAFLDRAFT_125152 [Branchiostoma floridae]
MRLLALLLAVGLVRATQGYVPHDLPRPKTDCSGNVPQASSSAQQLDSPNYPNNYGNNLDCTWTIQSASGTVIRLHFLAFSVEDRLTGNTVPDDFVSSGNTVTLQFTSDVSVVQSGFQLEYTEMSASSCPDPGVPDNGQVVSGGSPFGVGSQVTFGCNQGYNLVGQATITCNAGTAGGPASWDNPAPTCNGGSCGGDFVDASGTITSPGYPVGYDNNENCVYNIRAPSGNYIRLDFQAFGTESGFDFLKIFEGGNQVQRYSGQSLPPTFISSTNAVQLRFTSDGSVTGPGFSLTYLFTTSPTAGPVGTCPDPGSIVNGNRNPSTGSTFNVGDTITYSCNAGFQLVGATTLNCTVGPPLPGSSQPAGWDSAPPTCQVVATPTSATGCGGSLTAPSGGPFASPNYPSNYGNNEICEWSITAPTGSTIRLTFDEFDVELNYDFLYIYDGSSDSAPQLQRLTGSQGVDPITSTSNMVFLRFTSDQSVTAHGFQFSYTSIITGQCRDPGVPDNGNRDNDSNFAVGQTVTYSCMTGYQLQGTATITCQSDGSWSDSTPTCEASCGGTYTDLSGVIISPGYPNSYPNNAECVWTILGGTTSSGTPRLIELTFNSFSLESNYDFVYIYDGYTNGTQLNRFTGANVPDQQRSTTNILSIKMTTDGSVQQGGFQAAYQILGSVACDNPGAPQFGSLVTSVTGNSFPVGSQVTFSCDAGYDLSDNSPITCQSNGQWSGPVPTCDAACGGQRTESSGTIQSPGYPGQYGNNLNCEWVITSPTGAVVQLQFERLDLEDGYDILEVRDGTDGSSPLLQRLTGSNTPSPIRSTGSSLYLKLTTDYSVTQTGFRATFNDEVAMACPDPGVPANGNRDGDFFYVGSTVTFSCELGYVISDATPLTCQTALCGGYLTATEGIVLSKNYPNNYGNNLNCNWTVAVTPGKGINFQFNTFSLEANYDYLKIYIGDNPSTAAQSYTGQTVPNPYSANYHIVFLVLTSDQSVSTSGFNISYTTFDLSANCPFPGSINNGYSNQGSGNVFLVGESITYGCSPGYTLAGTATLTCINGNPPQWNHPLPQCQAQCGGTHSGPIGTILSFGYPNNYPNNLRSCAYEISVNPGEGIILTITDFQTAGPGDTLTIYDGTQDSPSLGSFSGNQLTQGQMFNSSSNRMLLMFNTDASGSARGFSITYRSYALPSECPDRGSPANGQVVQITGFGVGAFAIYDCDEGYTFRGNQTIRCVRSNPQSRPHWDSDLPTCTGYPGLYSNYQDCTWTLQAPQGQLFTLQFNAFDIETCGSDRSCTCDYLIVRDGDAATSPMAGGGRFCGQLLPPDISLNNTNTIRIEFHTDLSVTNQGFSIRYTSYLQTVCNDPGTPMNGSRTGGSVFSVGDTIYFQCDPGYILSGASSITCQGNSQAGVAWSGRTPTCEAPCGGRLTDPSGLILSPGYPNYPHNSDCTWTIVVQQGRVVELTFIYFQTETGYDYMNIYDGTNSSAQLGDQYTGHLSEQGNLPAPLRSSGNQMTVVFHSDSSVGGDGFQLSYQAIRRTFCLPLTAPMNGTMIGNNFNVFSTVSFSCDDGYELPSSCNQAGRCVLTCTSVAGTPTWDKPVPTCTAPCGGDRRPLVGMSEVIVSPNYPRNYDNSLAGCVWSISVDPGYVVHFEFVVFETESQFDTLTIYDGSSSSSPSLATLSGTHSGESYLSTGNNVQMRFTTNAQVTAKGFHTVITAVHGTSTSYCQDPGMPQFGSRQGNDFAIGQTVTFSCDPGFVLNDTAVLVCEQSSTIAMWNGTVPGCVGACGAYITGRTSGYIYSPNYPEQYGNNQNCQWTVEVSLGEGVKLTVESFILEEPYDKLKVYDGGSADSYLLGEYTGNTIPREIRATSNMVYLDLTTDYSVTDDGFKIRYETYGLVSAPCRDPGVPVNGYRTGDSFVVDAVVSFGCNEGFTLVGHDHITCMPGNRRDWNYPPPTCEGIELRFQNFSLEQDYDYLYLYDGPTTNSPLLGSFTGQMIPPVLYSQTNEVVITLSTDSSVKDDGFALQYEAFLSRYCVPTPPALQNGRIVGTSYAAGSVIRYDCDEGYIVSSPAVLTCQQDTLTWSSPFPSCDAPCGANYTALSGTILSPGYPGSYGNGRDCQWRIMLPDGMAVQFSFVVFDVEDGYDFLKFREGLSTSLPVTVQLTGTQVNDTYIPSNNVLVQLTSDYSVDGKFMMRYTVLCTTNDDRSDGSGVILSPGYPNNYPINTICGWTLHGCNGHPVTLSFEYFQSEGNYDKLEVFDAVCCNDPGIPDNGNRQGNSFNPNDRVTFTCNAGYTLVGQATATCLLMGNYAYEWTSPRPVCQATSCGMPRAPANGIIDGNDFTIGSTVTYKCNLGYRLPGSAVTQITCGTSGWSSNNPPACQINTCAQLPVPPNGRYNYLSGANATYNSVIQYTCNNGYNIQGSAQRQCQADGTWSGTDVQCVAEGCGDPGIPTNGNRQGNSFTYGSTVIYSCNEGFRLVGSSYLTCQANRQWNGRVPVCIPITCGDPGTPYYGNRDGDSFDYGNILNFTCNVGYILQGAPIIRCEQNGLWSNPIPTCTAVDCGDPGTVEHGHSVAQAGTTFGVTIEYFCDNGYFIFGSSSIRCQSNGQWDGTKPECRIVDCGDPGTSPNTIKGGDTTTTFGSTVTYSCTAGQNVVSGDTSRTCQADGTWSGAALHCSGTTTSCGDIGDPPHGSFLPKKSTYNPNDQITFSCDTGYNLQGSQSLTCQSGGAWSGNRPDCIIQNCGDPGRPSNGNYNTTGFTYSSTVLFSCNPGYMLSGTPSKYCTARGEWKPDGSPVCNVVNCGDPGVPASGVVTGSDYTYGHFVTYTCNTGHNLIGQANRTCQANGQWSNSLPACQVVNCGAPPRVPYSTVEGNSYTFGSSVSYNCSTGYRLIGPVALTCRANGQWGSNLLGTTQCVAVSCGDPGVPANGQRQGSRFTFGSRVTFTCDEGYILIGTNQQQCMADGRWSPSSLPVCQVPTQQSCRDPGTPDHGTRNATNFLPGTVVRFQCQDGYHILGPTSLVCDPATLSWNGQPPTCVPSNCAELEAPVHALIVVVQDLPGQGYTTIFTCQPGYTPTSGDTLRVCQDNGQWSGKPIVCEVGTKPSEKPPTVLYPSTPQPKPTVPVQAFIEGQIWTGSYEYKGRKFPCTLTITAVLQNSFGVVGDFDDGSSSFTLADSQIPNPKPQTGGKGLSGGSIAAAVLVPILCLAVLALGVYAWHLKRTGQRFSFFSRYGDGEGEDASFENPCYNTAEGVVLDIVTPVTVEAFVDEHGVQSYPVHNSGTWFNHDIRLHNWCKAQSRDFEYRDNVAFISKHGLFLKGSHTYTTADFFFIHPDLAHPLPDVPRAHAFAPYLCVSAILLIRNRPEYLAGYHHWTVMAPLNPRGILSPEGVSAALPTHVRAKCG